MPCSTRSSNLPKLRAAISHMPCLLPPLQRSVTHGWEPSTLRFCWRCLREAYQASCLAASRRAESRSARCASSWSQRLRWRGSSSWPERPAASVRAAQWDSRFRYDRRSRPSCRLPRPQWNSRFSIWPRSRSARGCVSVCQHPRRIRAQPVRRLSPARPRRRADARRGARAARQSPRRPDGAAHRAQRRSARPSGPDQLSRRPRRARGRRRRRRGAARSARRRSALPRERVQVLGRLADYETVTGYRVTPVVGWVEPPFALEPDPVEVADVFEVPLAFLLDPANQQRHFRMQGELRRDYWAIPYRRALHLGRDRGDADDSRSHAARGVRALGARRLSAARCIRDRDLILSGGGARAAYPGGRAARPSRASAGADGSRALSGHLRHVGGRDQRGDARGPRRRFPPRRRAPAAAGGATSTSTTCTTPTCDAVAHGCALARAGADRRSRAAARGLDARQRAAARAASPRARSRAHRPQHRSTGTCARWRSTPRATRPATR